MQTSFLLTCISMIRMTRNLSVPLADDSTPYVSMGEEVVVEALRNFISHVDELNLIPCFVHLVFQHVSVCSIRQI